MLEQIIIKYMLYIKMWISNSVRIARFWNNLHQVRSKLKVWKSE